MAPKKDGKEEEDDSDEYTYCTEEDEEEPDPMPSTEAVAAPVSPNEKAAVAAVRIYEARAAKDEPSSSDDRGPRARDRRPPSPARRERRERHEEPRGSRVPERETRDTREVAPFPSLPTPAPGLPPPPPPNSPRGNWTTKGRKQRCPHCWQKVGSGGSTSGMSQHMYWNEHCLTWQCYGDGTRCSWEEAVARAHEVKLGREREEYAELAEGVTPARSRQRRRAKEEGKEKAGSGQEGLPREGKAKRREHRDAVADDPRDHMEQAENVRRRRAEVPPEPEEKEETSGRRRKHKKHRHRRRSPSPDVRAGPKGPKKPPSDDDEDDRDMGSAKRRTAPDEVWIKVPRSALRGH